MNLVNFFTVCAHVHMGRQRDDNLGVWEPLREFIEAGGTTKNTQMRFNDRCENIMRSYNTGGRAIWNFERDLLRFLCQHLGIPSFSAAARRFGIAEEKVPIDEEVEAPVLVTEMSDAVREEQDALARADAARAQYEAAEARLAQIDNLVKQTPSLRESLEYLETLPAAFQEVIDACEKSIIDNVYLMPKYGYHDPCDSLINIQRRIESAKAAKAAHKERIEFARKKLADHEAKIAELKSKPKKPKRYEQ